MGATGVVVLRAQSSPDTRLLDAVPPRGTANVRVERVVDQDMQTVEAVEFDGEGVDEDAFAARGIAHVGQRATQGAAGNGCICGGGPIARRHSSSCETATGADQSRRGVGAGDPREQLRARARCARGYVSCPTDVSHSVRCEETELAFPDTRQRYNVRLLSLRGAVSKYARDLSKAEQDTLEVAGMTPREIDDLVSRLRIARPGGFTVSDVLACYRENSSHR